MILMSITVIPWMNEGTLILAAYESGHLVLFNMKQPKALHILKFDFGITCCDYDVLSNRGLLSGPSNVTVCVFGLDKEKLQLYRKEAEDIEYVPNDGQKLAGISCIKFRPDKKVIVVGTCDGIIYIHSHKSLRKFATLRNHRGEITDIAFSNGAIDNFKSPIMAVAGSDGNVSLWDIYYKWAITRLNSSYVNSCFGFLRNSRIFRTQGKILNSTKWTKRKPALNWWVWALIMKQLRKVIHSFRETRLKFYRFLLRKCWRK